MTRGGKEFPLGNIFITAGLPKHALKKMKQKNP